MTTLTFDTETSGFSQNRIVQFAAVLHNGKELACMNVLIQPDGWTIEEGAFNVHGISQQDCENFGIPIHGALWMFAQLCEKADIRIAHNADFDERVIGEEMKRIQQVLPQNRIVCTMKATTDIVKLPPTSAMLRSGRRGHKAPKLIEAHMHFFGEGFDGQHDALADVRACHRIYSHLVEENMI